VASATFASPWGTKEIRAWIEGPGWLRPEKLDDEHGLETAVRVARAVRQERTIIGASAHLLAIAKGL